MVTKKKVSRKKSESSKILDSVMVALEKFLLPNLVLGIKKKFHLELNYLTSHIEHKVKKITTHTMHEVIRLFIFLFGFTFFSFGLYYLFIDILNLSRAYVLLGLGFMMFVSVLLFGHTRVHNK